MKQSDYHDECGDAGDCVDAGVDDGDDGVDDAGDGDDVDGDDV